MSEMVWGIVYAAIGLWRWSSPLEGYWDLNENMFISAVANPLFCRLKPVIDPIFLPSQTPHADTSGRKPSKHANPSPIPSYPPNILSKPPAKEPNGFRLPITHFQ
jgi:hypothetical protein